MMNGNPFIGALIYDKPSEYGCITYRHREANKNTAYQFADENDAEVYAKKHNLIIIHKTIEIIKLE